MGAGASTAEGSELAELQQKEGLAASAAEVERVISTLPEDQQVDSVEQIVKLVSDCKVDGKSEAQIEEEILKCCVTMEKCSAQGSGTALEAPSWEFIQAANAPCARSSVCTQ